MIPFVVAGGVLLALAVMFSGKAAVPNHGFLKAMSDIGIAGLSLFIPILAGFIAYSMVEKPGIAPGAIGGYLANQMGAGFLGGMLAGIIAGLVVWMLLQIIARLKVPDFLPHGITDFCYSSGGDILNWHRYLLRRWRSRSLDYEIP
nr:hypothetical protein [Hafnia paralvei]